MNGSQFLKAYENEFNVKVRTPAQDNAEQIINSILYNLFRKNPDGMAKTRTFTEIQRRLSEQRVLEPTHITDDQLLKQIGAFAEQVTQHLVAHLEDYQTYEAYSPPVELLAECNVDIGWLERAVGQVCQRPVAFSGDYSLLRYEGEGKGRYPHVDRDVYHINLLFLISREHREGHTPHDFYYYDDAGERHEERLTPGHAILFDGANTVHGRWLSDYSARTLALSFGFRPI
ncbi:hypothetical protein [Deinococcus arcticus]|uniref:Uncharacterized protein n=1 Tax=Deinococcus arcticus TaxID=2136176 RepID=A0A2T3W3Q6_9DEIO|nr:hypothetical protein [Deinococcus arcticus]PTA66540.1 hypothetical protein C8263_17280 [Deinococcus arcticus]